MKRRPIPKIAKILWSTGFAIGTVSHVADITVYGWLPYEYMPIGFNLYWTSLTFLDPVAAALIWLRQRGALWLGCAIMGSNLVVNAWTVFGAGFADLLPGLVLQSLFAAFVFFVALGQRPDTRKSPDPI